MIIEYHLGYYCRQINKGNNERQSIAGSAIGLAEERKYKCFPPLDSLTLPNTIVPELRYFAEIVRSPDVMSD